MIRDNNHRNLKIVLIAVSLLATLWVQAPRLADPFRVDEDFRTFYWMNKFQEEGLYPNDQLRGHTYVTVRLPWGELPLYFPSLGYDLLFYVASFFVFPPLFSKLLPFLLMPVMVWYLFEYGMSVGGRDPATVLAAGFVFLNVASSTALSVTSGFQRGFACPLMVALLYYLHRRRPRAAAATVFVSALIYPPVFLLGAATSGLFFLTLAMASPSSLKTARSGLVALSVAFCIGALVLSPVMFPRILGTPGPQDPDKRLESTVYGDGQALNHARYQPGGRNPLFYLFPVLGRAGLVNKSLTGLHLLILMCVGGLICLVQRCSRSLRLPREMSCMVLGSLGLFAGTWASAFITGSFLLYLPSRYTRVGLLLFFSLFVFLNIGDAIEKAVRLVRSRPKAMVWVIVGVEVVALGFILFYPSSRTMFLGTNMKWLIAPASLLLAVLGAVSLGRPSTPATLTSPTRTTFGRVFIGAGVAISLIGWAAYARTVSKWSTLDPPAAEREMLTFVETLPKDVLLAGTPCTLDSVTLFAKRQVLFSCEHISEDDGLMLEALDAYYAEEAQAVLDFCEAHGVDYLVINRETYTQEYIDKGWIFFEPYNQELLPHVRARDSFALAQVPDRAKVFESDALFVVPCTTSAPER
ncbi:MAG: hypothetical protein U9R72_04785 [Chloroflexota bacterium]|nr:hypothetical protein [Chloroflexota bacterium]